MDVTVLCYDRCSTCKKALRWLDQRGCSYTLRPIDSQNPSEEELRGWHKRSGLPLRRFFNTSGTLYRTLGLKDKLDGMSEDEMFSLLASSGMLVKRPLLITEELVFPGFREDVWEKAL